MTSRFFMRVIRWPDIFSTLYQPRSSDFFWTYLLRLIYWSATYSIKRSVSFGVWRGLDVEAGCNLNSFEAWSSASCDSYGGWLWHPSSAGGSLSASAASSPLIWPRLRDFLVEAGLCAFLAVYAFSTGSAAFEEAYREPMPIWLLLSGLGSFEVL